MAITPGSSTTVAYASRTNTTVTTPAGAVAGSSVVAVSMTAGVGSLTPVTITPPGSGWEAIGDVFYTAPDPYAVRVVTYIRIHDGSASYTFTHAAASTQAFARVWEGVNTTTMQDCPPMTAAENGSTVGSTIVAPALTIVTAGAMGIINRGSWDGAAISPPTDWTESYDQPVMWIGYREYAATGSTGTVTVSAGNSGNSPRGVIHGALRPAAIVTGPAFDAAAFDSSPFYTADAGGPTNHALSGTVAATSAATGAITAQHPLSGTVAASSSATGSLALNQPVAGIAAATSATSGAIVVSAGLAGTIATTSTASGTITAQHPLAGAAAATSTVTGSPTSRQGVAGTVAATSATTGTFSLRAALSAVVSAVTSVVGSPTSRQGLSGNVNAVTGSSGTLLEAGSVTHQLVSNVVASTGTAGSIVARHPLSGSVAGVSAAVGTVTLRVTLAGSVPVVSQAAGVLASRQRVAGTVAATSGVTGAFVSEIDPLVLLVGPALAPRFLVGPPRPQPTTAATRSSSRYKPEPARPPRLTPGSPA